MARRLHILAATTLILVPNASLASAPASDWKLEPSDARCVAVRQYGTPEKSLTLAIKAPIGGEALQLAVLRTGYRKDTVQTGAKLKIDDRTLDLTALSYPISGDKRRVSHLINLNAEQAGALRSASALGVKVHEGVDDSFVLAPSKQVWTDLKDCLANLQNTWNYGPIALTRVATHAKGNLQTLFTSADYPLEMVRAGNSGSVTFVVLINEQGKVRDCTVTEPSGYAVFDSRSCGIITQRATFAPARDANGQPLKSHYFQTINWKIR